MTSAVALTAGALRLVADKHYATDVVVGATIGFLSGYGLPIVLHYRSGPNPSGALGERTVVVPAAIGEGFGLTALGAF